jgi:hypothetical protein
MGNYHSSQRDNRAIGDCLLTAIQDFADDLLRASEIEYIDLMKLQEEENLPIVFFAVNLSIDKVLITMSEKIPDMIPPMREYKKRIEK